MDTLYYFVVCTVLGTKVWATSADTSGTPVPTAEYPVLSCGVVRARTRS